MFKKKCEEERRLNGNLESDMRNWMAREYEQIGIKCSCPLVFPISMLPHAPPLILNPFSYGVYSNCSNSVF